MTVETYRQKTTFKAKQWDGTAACDDELFEWAIDVWERHEGGRPKVIRQLFMSFRPDNDFTEMEVGRERVAELKAEGYSAAVFNNDTGRWEGVRTGDWIVEFAPEQFRAVSPDDFARDYEPAGGEA
ncbi:hypothetical protein [Nocardia wallacei]|uniref:hypothetical protein n=1 Tax=Nocardia wallacei TaxID=480035 RepID=UPI00245817C3|nr:hypothetical protein [Nocardia wallacei]